jgi:hypothetical protein
MNMKTSYIKTGLKRLANATVAVWLGGLALNVRADSPVGNWDFYFTGDQQGVAQINFYPDFTVDGIEISSPGKLTKKPSNNPRSGVDDRDDPRSPSDPNLAYEYIYGTSVISGSWGYDPKGRVIGALILTSANVTNGWSFTGVAKVGTKTRMTMTTHHNTSIGLRSVFRGVMRGAALPSIAGTGGFAESGTMVNRINLSTQGYSRILQMSPGGAQNIYAVSEAGPGYDGSGFAIITRNNYIGIYTDHFAPGTTNTVIVTASGPFNPNKMTARLKGFTDGKYSIYSKLWSFDPLSP